MKEFALVKNRKVPHSCPAPRCELITCSHRQQQAQVRQILRRPTIQPKLTIRAPGDIYKQVAGGVAEQVMRMPEPGIQLQLDEDHGETNRLIILPPQAVNGSVDPIHGPLLEEYRRSTGHPRGGVNEGGRKVGPSDAELKYSGILGRFGTARWLSPVINRRNFAEVQFHSTGLAGTGGLTTQLINEQEIHSNLDVESAIPSPPVESRTEGGMTRCWFSRGVNVTGRTTMDIFTPGPWNFTVPGADTATRYSWDRRCREGTGQATIHIDARPSDAAMEEYIRLGEAEHDVDTHQAFNDNIAVYVANVNRLLGDTPATRISGPDLGACQRSLRRLENRALLTQFVIDLNTATANRHAGGRHSIAHTGISINDDYTRIIEEMRAGNL